MFPKKINTIGLDLDELEWTLHIRRRQDDWDASRKTAKVPYLIWAEHPLVSSDPRQPVQKELPKLGGDEFGRTWGVSDDFCGEESLKITLKPFWRSGRHKLGDVSRI